MADTCLGFTAVAMAEVFSELEKRDEEVRTSRLVVLDLGWYPFRTWS